MADTYKVIRFYRKSGYRKTIHTGKSRSWVEAWCSREDTHKKKRNGDVVWFDGFTKE